MDNILNKFTNQPEETQGQTVAKPQEPKMGWKETINSKLGGGRESEKKEGTLMVSSSTLTKCSQAIDRLGRQGCE